MKKLYLVLLVMVVAIMAAAQMPETISYQAVFRNVDGTLMVEQQVDVEFTVIDESTYNNTLYIETHTTTTGEHGLVTLDIGAGAPMYGVFQNIKWTEVFGIEVAVDGEYLSTSLMTATPFAFYANVAKAVEGIDFTKFLTEEDIPVVNIPTKLSEFDNDVGFITLEDLPDDTDSVYVIPTKLSDLDNDLPQVQIPKVLSYFVNDEEYVNKAYVDSVINVHRSYVDSMHVVFDERITRIENKLRK